MANIGRGRRVARTAAGPRSAVELACDALRARILSGQLTQGTHIAEQSLADALGVGRATLREALRVLEHDGLMVHVPRAGTKVVTLTLQDAYEIVTLREHLEELAIVHGIPADPDRLAALDATVQQLERSAAAGDEENAVPDSLTFHRAFIDLAGHSRLTAAFGTILYPLGLLMHLNRQAQSNSESLDARAHRHRRLFELIAAGDGNAVATEMHAHSTTRFLKTIQLSDENASDAALDWAQLRANSSNYRLRT